MLKLTYSLPHDKFQTVTILGDAKGLCDLYWRLTNANPKNENDAASNIKIHTLSGIELNPCLGINEFFINDKPLSQLDN